MVCCTLCDAALAGISQLPISTSRTEVLLIDLAGLTLWVYFRHWSVHCPHLHYFNTEFFLPDNKVVTGFKVNYSPTYGIVNTSKKPTNQTNKNKNPDNLKSNSEHNSQHGLHIWINCILGCLNLKQMVRWFENHSRKSGHLLTPVWRNICCAERGKKTRLLIGLEKNETAIDVLFHRLERIIFWVMNMIFTMIHT